MPKYRVPVQRTSFSSADFVVDASSPTEAKVKAEEEAGDYEFGSGNAEYEVDDPVELSEVYLSYEGGECPDCGEDIPTDAEEGHTCSNCGHAFFLQRPDDDNKGVVISRTINLIDVLKAHQDPNNDNLIMELEKCLVRHNVCLKCGEDFSVHNGDGSCIED